MKKYLLMFVIFSAVACMAAPPKTTPGTYDCTTEPHGFSVFMQDGGWCWYQDPRAIIHDGKLIIGGVSGQSGNVKVSVYDLKAEKDLGTEVLHAAFQRDDHNTPALYARPDGSLLAMYTKHATDRIHRYRISDSKNYLAWGDEREFVHDYTGGWGVTYMNLYYLKDEGLLYNFFRDGMNINPSFITSSDQGETWGNRTHFIADELGWQRPYARYVQRDANTIGVSFTDAHPRQYGNNLYYAEFSNGTFYRADGSKIKKLADGPLSPSEAECIYKGSQTKKKPEGFESVPNSAWTSSIAVDAQGYPHIGYSLYLSDSDHRYRIASWDGKTWHDREVAFGGKCLYTQESSYTGLITLDPSDPGSVYISTDVNPATGKDLGGTHEIYSASIRLGDDIETIKWKAITSGSSQRNIRPVVVADGGFKALLWQAGTFNTYTDYDLDVKGLILARP